MGHLGSVALAAVAALAVAGAPGDKAPDPKGVAEEMLRAYLADWDRADAGALAAQFAPDGDFINPDGFYARGPAEVEAFYRSAFARGYAGRPATFTLKAARLIAPRVIAVDGVWSIAAGADGRASPQERGLATVVLVRTPEGWRVAALREQSSASQLNIPATP